MPFSPIPAMADVKAWAAQKTMPGAPFASKVLKGLTNPHFSQFAYSMGDLVSGASTTSPPCYYGPFSTLKDHGDSAKEVGKLHKDFVHEALDKIKSAVTSWKPKAKVKSSVQIMSVCAIGPPGSMDTPDIKSEPSFSSWTHKEKNGKAYIKACVTGFSKCWMDWHDKIAIPGMPWYPAFAAFPLAMATPTPNIPMPLITLISAMMTRITVYTELKDEMIKNLDGDIKKADKDKQYEMIFEAIAFAVSMAGLMWLPAQMVMNVLGKGPVPPYAPPYVPVGPVVAGAPISTPGPLAAG